MILLFKI